MKITHFTLLISLTIHAYTLSFNDMQEFIKDLKQQVCVHIIPHSGMRSFFDVSYVVNQEIKRTPQLAQSKQVIIKLARLYTAKIKRGEYRTFHTVCMKDRQRYITIEQYLARISPAHQEKAVQQITNYLIQNSICREYIAQKLAQAFPDLVEYEDSPENIAEQLLGQKDVIAATIRTLITT